MPEGYNHAGTASIDGLRVYGRGPQSHSGRRCGCYS
ncbi:unnamed protein product [Penicillium roqueforti FM164]|uniref:Uncharacterized protein n=1 Tax=Penicillium roqueforti (strain FM164) TaxID=1365484 RepID=W6QLT6_PENRF|nr:unnamed protein product [Penicillium roqueforti FM164]